MADMVIGDYTAAVTIDGNTNYLLIQPGNSSTAYKKINRNVFLGVTGQPVDISTVQSLTNKTLDNTNTITVKDSLFTMQDNSDTAKQAQFQLSGITTGNTRVYTLPDATTTLVGTGVTQTLTNKTLTSPTISGGTIDNSTVTVDSVAGHTSANSGTIYGITVTSGTIPAAGLASSAVTTAKIADGAVTPAKLTTGTGSSWAWTNYTPTFTGFSSAPAATGTRYIQMGKMVIVNYSCFGGTSNATSLTATLPVTASTNGLGSYVRDFYCRVQDNSATPTTAGLIEFDIGATTINVYKDQSGAAFTGSGTKGFRAVIMYEAA